MAQPRADYYAFISYNHRDARWAKWIQGQLEHYRLPAALLRDKPGLPKRLTPVFLDRSDLVAHGGLLDSLREKLDASNFLIVLCSPNSARSPWVDQEVAYFINTGRKDRIIPLIIAGEPHAADPGKECYPPALAALSGSEELLGVSVPDYGKRGAFLRVLATILNLKLDQVAVRDAAYRRKKRLISALGAVFLAAAAVYAVWELVEFPAYYRDCTYVWDVPVGIGKALSARERQGLEYTYRIVTRRGKAIRLERVNSADVLVAPLLAFTWTDPPYMEFSYSESGYLNEVKCYDANKRLLYQKLYDGSPSGQTWAVEFKQAVNSNDSFSLSADMLSYQLSQSSTSEDRGNIRRFLQSYDAETGYLTRQLFKQNDVGLAGGKPARDSNGFGGFLYLRDALGRVTGIRYLDRNGDITASAAGDIGSDYAYGENGYVVSETYIGPDGTPGVSGLDGYAYQTVSYDAPGRPVAVEWFEADHAPVEGVAAYRFSYDGRGFLTSMSMYDGAGSPFCDEQGIFRTDFGVDAEGRIVRNDYYGADGSRVVCADGYAVAIGEYNGDGQLILARFFGADGVTPAMDLTWEVYGFRFSYEDKLRTRMDCLGADGVSLIRSNRGCASVCMEYEPQRRQLSLERYLDETGAAVPIYAGYAQLAITYRDDGDTFVREERCLDASGDPCLNRYGVSRYVYTYADGRLTRLECFGTQGEPVDNVDGYSVVTWTYDDFGAVREKTGRSARELASAAV